VTEGWTRYYEAAGTDPRPTLRAALERFGDTTGLAVDLGCGAGRDTLALLERGWTVHAIDAEQEAIDRLLASAPQTDGLHTQVASFVDARWPTCDLLNSSYALPFCDPADFTAVWARIVESIVPGGRFAGQLFGDRDEWRGEEGMTFHRRSEAEALFADFELEQFDEHDEDGTTAVGAQKHWHLFHVVARKR
jgi:tellurite methyltransferase